MDRFLNRLRTHFANAFHPRRSLSGGQFVRPAPRACRQRRRRLRSAVKAAVVAVAVADFSFSAAHFALPLTRSERTHGSAGEISRPLAVRARASPKKHYISTISRFGTLHTRHTPTSPIYAQPHTQVSYRALGSATRQSELAEQRRPNGEKASASRVFDDDGL